jgi:hypothetical protein
LTPWVITSICATGVAILALLLLFLVVRGGSRPTVLRGILKFRELRFGKAHTAEHYERETVSLTFDVAIERDKETLTINAEGAADDVRKVTGVLTDLLTGKTGKIPAPPPELDVDTSQARSTFTVIRHVRPREVADTAAEVDFTVIDDEDRTWHLDKDRYIN